jgi:hypothetical protein
MGYRRSIADSVSVGEMMHMREVLGLSNGEIAKKVGCCTNTVIRMIGPHPEGKGARRKTAKPLPPPENLGHKSFRERCEEVLGVPDVVTVTETVVKGKDDLQKRLDELTLLFGKEAVRGYLRCVGHQAGTSIGMPVMTCEECLEALRKLEDK